jgi:hypothetical protein
MAVLDHDHSIVGAEHRQPEGSVIQFCGFWFGVFALIGLVTVLFSS